MSQYYTPLRTRNLFNPKLKTPFKISRSKLDMFLECPRCFYLDRRLGVGRPPGYPFNLNSAVDALLKQEFDIHRANRTAHPLMEEYGIKAVPFQHEKMDEWRDSLRRGIQYWDEEKNLIITGGVDDVWVNTRGELIIVDYKATSKDAEITSLDQKWQDGYKRQMEIYQWLFRKNGFKVSDTGYFVYCNGKRDKKAFDGKLEFDVRLIPYTGDTSWIEPTVEKMYKCLRSSKIPKAEKECDYCRYVKSVSSMTK